MGVEFLMGSQSCTLFLPTQVMLPDLYLSSCHVSHLRVIFIQDHSGQRTGHKKRSRVPISEDGCQDGEEK